MRIRRAAWHGFAAALAATSPAAAQGTLSDSAVRQIDAVFAAYTPQTPGCALGVYQSGRIAFEKGYGSANIEYGVPFTPETPTIMGSVSKQFTAAAIALLVEQGRISLDDDVRKYVPELPDYGKRITIEELVHHTSGLRDFWALVDAAGMRFDDGYTVADVVSLAARQRHLNFDPGTEYNYSNTGYVLLGLVVQRASGEPLRQFAAEQIFAPLGMASSHFQDDHTEPVRGRASAYSPIRGGGWRIDVWNNDIVGQGGLMTTVEDLQKWDENFYDGRVGGPAFLARQLERGRLANGTQIAYAFGLEIGEYRGLPIVEHAGSTGGYRTAITRFPAQHTTVTTLCNVSTADATGMGHRVADVVLAGRFTKPAPVAAGASRAAARQAGSAASVPAARLASLAGTYYSEELDASYELTSVGSAFLVKKPRATAPDTLRAIDSVTFRASGYTLRFLPTSHGEATSFTLDNGRVRGVEFRRSRRGE
jgi:CubicO group peptidase (beta-lactamase class C family)